MGLRSPYGNGPNNLPSPIPNPSTPLPNVPEMGSAPAPQGQQVYNEPAGPPAPLSAEPLNESEQADLSALESLSEEEQGDLNALMELDTQDLPNPIDSQFSGKEMEGNILFGTMKVRQNKEGDIEVWASKPREKSPLQKTMESELSGITALLKDKTTGFNIAGATMPSNKDGQWVKMTDKDKDYVREVYSGLQEGKLTAASVAGSIPGMAFGGFGGVVARSLGTFLSTGVASKFLARPADDTTMYLERKASGLTDQDVANGRDSLRDATMSLLGQGIGEIAGGVIGKLHKKELDAAKRAVTKAQAFRTAENITAAAEAVGVRLTPEQAIAAQRVSPDLTKQAAQILNDPTDVASRDLMLANWERSQKELLESVKAETNGMSPRDINSIRASQVGGQEKNFLDVIIDEKTKNLSSLRGQILEVARKRGVVPMEYIEKSMDKILSKRLSTYDVFHPDGTLSAEKLFKLTDNNPELRKKMGEFIPIYKNIKNAAKREVGELGKPQSPLMKDVFEQKTSGPAVIDSQDPLSGLGSPREYTATGQGGTLPGSGGDFNTIMSRAEQPPQTLGSRVDYPYGVEQTLPGKVPVASNQHIAGDTLSVKGKPQSGRADKDLEYLMNLVDNVQEAAKFDATTRSSAELSFGELANDLRMLENDVVASVLTESGNTKLASRVLDAKDWYSKNVASLRSLSNNLGKSVEDGSIGDYLFKRGKSDIDLVMSVASEPQKQAIRSQYLKSQFHDALFENGPNGTVLRGNITNPAKSLFTNANIDKTVSLFGEDGTKRLKTLMHVAEGLNTLKQGSTVSLNNGLKAVTGAVMSLAKTKQIPIGAASDFVSGIITKNDFAREMVESTLGELAAKEEAKLAAKKSVITRKYGEKAKRTVRAVGPGFGPDLNRVFAPTYNSAKDLAKGYGEVKEEKKNNLVEDK